MKPGYILFLFACLSCYQLAAQPASRYNPAIDVQHYHLSVAINDANDTLSGKAAITVKFIKSTAELSFDLTSLKENGTGLVISAVSANHTSLNFIHKNNLLTISLNKAVKPGEEQTFSIQYKGIPADGLIFSKNKYGHRTVFADNWPNRAHNWFPCVDHPSDKASVAFDILAPKHFQVVANGVLTEQRDAGNGMQLSCWKETVPLPTKVMAIGVAAFAVNFAGNAAGVPVYSWVFPENASNGFYDYAQATDILPYFARQIGAYPFKKLANVQSKTRFGGMENASAIFYDENSVTGTRKTEALLAHEIAHQWFGNSVTEINWPHLWLSEGFATYMTDLYMESKYGKDTLTFMLKKQRDKITAFSKQHNTAVIDSTTSDYMQLLNANSYEKGAWILHMLRRKLGDNLFWKGIAAYYETYKNKNAGTDNFRMVMERTSGINLNVFFKQWLYSTGQPQLDVIWNYDIKKKEVNISIKQLGNLYIFPLKLNYGAHYQTVNITSRINHFTFVLNEKPAGLTLDPDTDLLFEATIKEIP